MQVEGVDRRGIRFRADAEEVVDVCFDGRRIFSAWLHRDSVPTAVDGVRLLPWPSQLIRFLDGRTDLTVVGHLSGRTHHAQTVQLGRRGGPIAVADEDGRPLGVDKSGRIAHTFETRSPEQTRPLLDAIERVLGAIREAGIEAFPAYGTLLGAVREGRLIGHDSDADLGYVSRHEAPVDVVRESFELARRLQRQGFTTHRYSGIAFKIDVRESDGSLRGLDVFGGFLTGGRLYLMGEVGAPFDPGWIYPLGTTTLEGRTLPAPAHPEHLLEAMYGPGWKVPDPAYKFSTPPETSRRLDGWFRGVRAHQNDWSRRYSRVHRTLPPIEPSALAELVAQEAAPGSAVIDVGGGRGGDALWLARRGFDVTVLDFVPAAATAAVDDARAAGQALVARRLNLNEWRSWLSEGARLAHRPGPRTILARHVADAVPPLSRDSLWRLCAMALRGGGRLHVEFLRQTPDQSGRRTKDLLTPLDQGQVVRELVARGARIVSSTEVVETPPPAKAPETGPRPVGRLVAEWVHDGPSATRNEESS